MNTQQIINRILNKTNSFKIIRRKVNQYKINKVILLNWEDAEGNVYNNVKDAKELAKIRFDLKISGWYYKNKIWYADGGGFLIVPYSELKDKKFITDRDKIIEDGQYVKFDGEKYIFTELKSQKPI